MNKRARVGDSDYEYRQFIWKENGPEQKMLENMFLNGTITEKDTPKTVRDCEPVFQKFTLQVFGNHFRKLKSKIGTTRANEDETSEILPSQSSANVEPLSSNKILYNHPALQSKFNFNPVFKWTYFDYDEKCTKVCVGVAMIGGATDIKFDFAEDGNQIIIEYAWPTTLFRPNELFEAETKDKQNAMNTNHPKILAMITELLNVGITENSQPKGNIVTELPVKVQKELGTWTKLAIKKADGDRIVVLEFRGFMKQEIINDADKTIKFN